MNRIYKIMERIGEIRARFHLDAASPSAMGLQPGAFAKEITQASERLAGPQNVLRSYDTSMTPRTPAVADTTNTQPMTAAERKPPPLPALPFHKDLEPYLPSMTPKAGPERTPRAAQPPLLPLGTTPGASLSPGRFTTPPGNAQPPTLPALDPFLQLETMGQQQGIAARLAETMQRSGGLGPQTGDLGALQGLLGQGGLGVSGLESPGSNSLLDLYRRLGGWDRALKAYNESSTPVRPGGGGLPFP